MCDETETAIASADDQGIMEWCREEFSSVDLGDKRLNRRLIETAGQMAAHPQAPINQACEDCAATKASYRLFANERATEHKIMKPHQECTQKRMRGHPLVLAVQDTTYIDYTAHPKTKGLGPIGTKKQNLSGFVMHPTLILTPEGLPLGVLVQNMWVRPQDEPEKEKDETYIPIEEKESYKWLANLEKTVELTPEGVQVVSVCDREADIFEFFVRANELKQSILVRSTQNRLLVDNDLRKLWAAAEAAPLAGHLSVQVPAQRGEPERQAQVSVRFCSVTLRPPWRPKQPGQGPLPSVTMYIVLAQEVNPPADATPLEWLLLTNVPVYSFEDAMERIKWYRCRWHIEVYFKVLKSGCKVEDCRLQTADRLRCFLAMSIVIAWRLYWLVHINRCCPEAPCIVVLADHEWQALYAKIHRTTLLPKEMPTVRQVVRWIAQLGGFLGRKGDGEPGVTTIWRGWQRLTDISETWLLLNPPNEHATCG
jgi:hypothetical protein